MKTAAAYIRVSTDDQTEYSPGSQLKAIKKYADEHDMKIPEEYIFVDEGISGRIAEKRPSFRRMIDTARQKPKRFDVILLWKFSRFARNRRDSIVYKSMLRKQCGIDVVSISEQLSDDNTSVLIEALIEAMDEYYSLNLAEEVKRGMNEKFSRGGVVSQPPFGYKIKNGVFVPDEQNAGFVRMIFSDFLSGTGIKQIAAKLNDMGIRTARGNEFENRSVEYILTNPTYTGKLRRSKNGRDASDRFHQSKENTVIVEGHHEPLISDDIFDSVREKLADNKKLYSARSRKTPPEFMLKGLVRCGNCGSTLTMMSSGKYLQCNRYSRGSCKMSHCISVNKLNEAVTEKIVNDMADMRFYININSALPCCPSPDISALKERENKKLLRIREAYESGADTLEEYTYSKAKIMSRISELEKQAVCRDETKERLSLTGCTKNVKEIFDAPQAGEFPKNIILRSFVDSIVFFKQEQRIEIRYKL